MPVTKTVRVVTSDGPGISFESHAHQAETWITDHVWLHLTEGNDMVATYAARNVVSVRFES